VQQTETGLRAGLFVANNNNEDSLGIEYQTANDQVIDQLNEALDGPERSQGFQFEWVHHFDIDPLQKDPALRGYTPTEDKHTSNSPPPEPPPNPRP
jgi:hypothetical protein